MIQPADAPPSMGLIARLRRWDWVVASLVILMAVVWTFWPESEAEMAPVPAPGAGPASLAATLVRPAAKPDTQSAPVLPVDLEVIDWRFQVNPQLAQNLGLTETERMALETLVGQTRQAVREQELSRCLTENGPTSSLLYIPAYPEEGLQIRAQFETEMRRALGDDNANQVLSASASALDSACGNFGQMARMIRIRGRTELEKIEHPETYHADVWAGPFEEPTFRDLAKEGSGGYFAGGTMRAIIFQEVPEELAPFLTEK
jgi:hypothetical protein